MIRYVIYRKSIAQFSGSPLYGVQAIQLYHIGTKKPVVVASGIAMPARYFFPMFGGLIRGL